MPDAEWMLQKTLEKVSRTASRVQDGIPYRTVGGLYDSKEDEIDWWTNGFWGGVLWLACRETRDGRYGQWAEGVERKLDAAMEEFFHLHHDVGFQWMLTSVAHYAMTGSAESARRGMKAASLLASRFNPKGSFLRAWNGADRNGWAIIDCMMNLSILYWASDYLNDPRFSNIAQAHAETTMRHFIRADGSSKHICVFDAGTGEYLRNLGGQGYSEESAWSRGAAWALYGFAISARETGRADFLDTARRIANFFLSHLPEDCVPFADFKAPEAENLHKDTSAAAIAASGLLALAGLTQENEAACYRKAAGRIVASLFENYTDWEHDEALLTKGCVAYHEKQEFTQTSLIYGDYFFLEALVQLYGGKGLF